GVRESLHLRAGRAVREPGRGSHLYLGRSAHRFRDARGVRVDDRTSVQVPETSAQGPMGLAVPPTGQAVAISPINRRRWENFKANRRGYVSFWGFLVRVGL